MMRIAVGHPKDLTDSYLRFVTQLGVDCIDFGEGAWMPGVAEQGYPDLDEVLKLRRRLQSWGLPLVLDEIHNYGRKGRIFMVHFRNVRGSLATAGGYEEMALDDGDMNMFKIIQALDRVGFDGCINPDHIPTIEGDYANGMTGEPVSHQGLAYAVGYIKALLAAMQCHQ
jgi:D-mannonate dehydratase